MLFVTHSFVDLLGDLESFLEVFDLCFQIRSLDRSVIHILQCKGATLESLNLHIVIYTAGSAQIFR